MPLREAFIFEYGKCYMMSLWESKRLFVNLHYTICNTMLVYEFGEIMRNLLIKTKSQCSVFRNDYLKKFWLFSQNTQFVFCILLFSFSVELRGVFFLVNLFKGRPIECLFFPWASGVFIQTEACSPTRIWVCIALFILLFYDMGKHL